MRVCVTLTHTPHTVTKMTMQEKAQQLARQASDGAVKAKNMVVDAYKNMTSNKKASQTEPEHSVGAVAGTATTGPCANTACANTACANTACAKNTKVDASPTQL
eukprot:Blabericola_migrator_1__3549@NODE_2052_length_3356_cov_89_705990_g1302_i0_p7_GENE_NODE_2052_length_3356_cov_89_705990_g1302_i0NODE_2052_length_3356_cov_89_705990_g1302_i0_p7_ORF_typecomplete_len104_score30_58YmdB/PF13277_6/0_035AZUL/PF16558_5/74AZUL/PF16558_5/6_4_NODE_2052_length_3356_cov_89_705990_g1302_i023172628